MLPNFMIVGAPKAGTTSLYNYLSEHPQIFMSTPKEVNYFSREEIVAQDLYYKDFKIKKFEEYERLFDDAIGKVAVGEASVSYLFYPDTPEKIKATLSDVKIIIILRNPIERGFSHYLMDYRMGLVNLSYEEIVNKTGNNKNIDLYYQQHVELGLYYNQVKRYLDIFGSDKVKIFLTEDLREDINKVVYDLYDFLNVDTSFIPYVQKKHNAYSMPKNRLIHKLYSSQTVRMIAAFLFPVVLKNYVKNIFFERIKKPQLDSFLKEKLKVIYKSDIKNLEQLINKDLSAWY